MFVHPLRILSHLEKVRARMPRSSPKVREYFAIRDFAVEVATRLGHAAQYYDANTIRCQACGGKASCDVDELTVRGTLVRERCTGAAVAS